MTTYYPVEFPPQFYVSNPTSYANHVIKCYEEGTSTPLAMSTDSVGSATVSSIALNASGLPEVSGNVVIPHIAENYKLVMYPTQAAADSNSGAVWTVDSIKIGSVAADGALTDVASAATVNLNSTETNYFNITGTTGISAITLNEGSEVRVKFAGALTITDSANLINLGGENITTAAGDIAVFRGEASNVVRMLSYEKANGTIISGASTSGQVPVSDGAGGSAWGEQTNTIPNGGYSTRYYYGGVSVIQATAVTVTADRLYYYPFIVSEKTTFTRIGINCQNATPNYNVRLGLYDSENGQPNDLVFDAGEISVTATGDDEITISQALAAGVYWVACVFSAAGNPARRNDQDSGLAAHIFGGTTGSTGQSQDHVYEAHTYGALPSSAGSVTYSGNGINDVPGVWLRKV